MKRVDFNDISDRLLLLNLYVTQAILLALACVLLWWQNGLSTHLFSFQWRALVWGAGAGLFIVAVDVKLSRHFPHYMADDGGINERLFQQRPYWHIFLMAFVVAFCEELLFRGAIQPLIGIWGTSVLFTLIHFRYLQKWLMVVVLFCISMVLGGLMVGTGSLWAPFITHFTVDFTLGLLVKWGRFKMN